MTLPPDWCERIFAGDAPLKVWREFRGLAVTDLRKATSIAVSRIEKLERGIVQPTRAEALKLARALDIPAMNLTRHSDRFRSCSDLDDLDEDAIIAAHEDE